MDKTLPPVIEGTLPAFYDNFITIPFEMNRAVNINDIKGMSLKIKTVQSNYFIGTLEYRLEAGEDIKETFSLMSQPSVTFTIPEFIMKKLNVGQYYKVQLAYLFPAEESSYWAQEGYYSTIAVIKYTTKPEIKINNLNEKVINTHLYQYTGFYSQENKDFTEKVYSYIFNLYDKNKNLLKTSGEQIHNSSNDIENYYSIDNFKINQDLMMNECYFLEYIVTTTNKMRIESPLYRIMQQKTLDPNLEAYLSTSLNYEDGYINVTLKGYLDNNGNEKTSTGSFKLLRASSEESYCVWDEILTFSLYGEKPSKWLWKDFTVKQGVSYIYAVQQYNIYDLVSNRIEADPIYADFEHAFLFDGKRQLKIKYNPKVTSFKNTVLENKTDTIGSQHPFIFRNGKVKYKEFPISGLISYFSDENYLFMDSFYNEEDKTTNLTSQNIANERVFKLEVLDWLTNGEPKLFRAPSEGNYIIRLLNVSLSPTDAVNRMLHTFTGTGYEIGEFNYENLAKFNLINIPHSADKHLRWETVMLNTVEAGQSLNLLKYAAISLIFEGMTPGDRVYINDGIKRPGMDVEGFYVTIGSTGSYELNLDQNITIKKVSFYSSYDQLIMNPIIQHQGQLTYGYYAKEMSRFDSVKGIETIDVPSEQFIGKLDLLDKIQDVKTSVQEIQKLTFTARELFEVYNNNGVYYEDAAFQYPVTIDPFAMYLEINTNSYVDGLTGEIFGSYNPCININGVKIDIGDTLQYTLDTIPSNLKNITVENGVITEISYIKQVKTYALETSDDLVSYRKKLYDNALTSLKMALTQKASESDLKTLSLAVETTYSDFVSALSEALEREEASQGEEL